MNKGVATTYLSFKKPVDGEPQPRAPIFIRKSQFRLPTKPETPIIMIGNEIIIFYDLVFLFLIILSIVL